MPTSRSAVGGVDPAIDVLIGVLPDVASGDRPLVAGSPDPRLVAALEGAGAKPSVWNRRSGSSGTATAWPMAGPNTAAFVRMPKSKDELDFTLDAVASQLPIGAPITVFGANDEGIRSASARLERFVEAVTTLDTRRHCRVISGPRRSQIDGYRGQLALWRHEATLDLGRGPRPWITYPGVFAHGRLDDGTRMLLAHLPTLAPESQVLDYASGTGIIAAAVGEAYPTARLDLLDTDAIALSAAAENVPGAQILPGSSLRATGAQKYAAILSNPPIHDGVVENLAVLERLIADAPARLVTGGVLQFVVQRRVKVRPWLEAAFSGIDMIADDGRFTVWRARGSSRKVTRPSRP